MMKLKPWVAALVLSGTSALMLPSLANATSVAVFGGSDGSQTANVVSDLTDLGLFSSVTMLDGSESAAQLGAYDSILVYSNSATGYPSFGDSLADYADAGGGLVVATFIYQTIGGGYGQDYGRLQSEGYLPFESFLGNYSDSTLGAYDATNPIMAGPLPVNAISGYFRDIVTLSSDATLVASWADGAPLVAIDSSNVVGVFLFPNDYYSSVSGDYMNLFGNALVYAADPVPEPETYALMLAGLGLVGFAARRRKN